MRLYFLIAILLLSSKVWGFGIGSEHNQLANKVIAAVGEAKELDPPSGTEWTEQVYSLGDYCFTMPGYYGYWGYGSKSAMLLLDDKKHLELAVLETSISSINVKLNSISMIQCPKHTSAVPSCDGLTPAECKTLLDVYIKKLKQ